MPIVNLRTDSPSGWKKAIIDNYAFLPYWWIGAITTDSRRSLMRRELDESVAGENAVVLGYLSPSDGLVGFSQVSRLEWDSNHFGFEIWRLDDVGYWGSAFDRLTVTRDLIHETIRSACGQGCQSIQARIPIDNLPAAHALEDAGFRTMEIRMTWIFDLARSAIPPKRNPDVTRDFRSSDTESLIGLARTAHASMPGRFQKDPRLSTAATNELYAEWMRNSCSGQMADVIAVAESADGPIAYATMKYMGDHDGLCNARIGELGLGAALPQFRNQGLVTDLIIHNLEWLKGQNGDFCIVATQGNNIPSQKLWPKAGFTPALMQLTLHYWSIDHG